MTERHTPEIEKKIFETRLWQLIKEHSSPLGSWECLAKVLQGAADTAQSNEEFGLMFPLKEFGLMFPLEQKDRVPASTVRSEVIENDH